MTTPLTVAEHVRSVAPDLGGPNWPPDVFAVCMSLLQRSGAYCAVVESWPPKRRGSKSKRSKLDWAQEVKATALEWSTQLSKGRTAPPKRVQDLWATLLQQGKTRVCQIRKATKLTHALLELSAISDETCKGVGAPTAFGESTLFELLLDIRLIQTNTLCANVDPTRLRVYPKCHTPLSGITPRSLSHHLALLETGEVTPRWKRNPFMPPKPALNFLVMPWPREVQPSQFQEATGALEDMPPEFGFFDFRARRIRKSDLDRLRQTLKAAREQTGDLDAVVFPECSMLDEDFKAVRREVCDRAGCVLIAGTAGNGKTTHRNTARVAFPKHLHLRDLDPQHKHHRWQLDRSQIVQYGLGSRLSPMKLWWENIPVAAREISFFPFAYWLTMSVLICEDLSRQDPISEFVRAVGPNLVIALLLDGPQLAARWPARYATVLAEDPGSSVLTVTSLGMSELSRPAGCVTPSRTIALWKDARGGGPREISLPRDAEGVVLCLANEPRREWTADGRDDSGTTYYPILAGEHPVFLDSPKRHR